LTTVQPTTTVLKQGKIICTKLDCNYTKYDNKEKQFPI